MVLSVKMSLLYSVKVGAKFSVADVLGRRGSAMQGKCSRFGVIPIRIRFLAELLQPEWSRARGLVYLSETHVLVLTVILPTLLV